MSLNHASTVLYNHLRDNFINKERDAEGQSFIHTKRFKARR